MPSVFKIGAELSHLGRLAGAFNTFQGDKHGYYGSFLKKIEQHLATRLPDTRNLTPETYINYQRACCHAVATFFERRLGKSLGAYELILSQQAGRNYTLMEIKLTEQSDIHKYSIVNRQYSFF
jgi:hypothetical protein